MNGEYDSGEPADPMVRAIAGLPPSGYKARQERARQTAASRTPADPQLDEMIRRAFADSIAGLPSGRPGNPNFGTGADSSMNTPHPLIKYFTDLNQ